MGKLRKLRRQIERDPCAWIHSHRMFDLHKPPRVRHAIEGKRGNFIPGHYVSYWNGNGPYQQFVRRVLLDLGYNVR